MRPAILHAIVHLLALVCSCAYGAWPYDACCEIDNAIGNTASGGSGALVGVSDDSGLVLSCAHVFANEQMTRKEIGRVSVRFPAAGKYPARVLAVDLAHDLSALRIERPEGVEPVATVKITKADGPFTGAGYPSFGKFRYYQADLTNFEPPCRAILNRRCYSGFSGGPLFNQYGELAGVLVQTGPSGEGRTPTYTVAIAGDVLVKFVRKWVKD
jgi:hypothetical protein